MSLRIAKAQSDFHNCFWSILSSGSTSTSTKLSKASIRILAFGASFQSPALGSHFFQNKFVLTRINIRQDWIRMSIEFLGACDSFDFDKLSHCNPQLVFQIASWRSLGTCVSFDFDKLTHYNGSVSFLNCFLSIASRLWTYGGNSTTSRDTRLR